MITTSIRLVMALITAETKGVPNPDTAMGDYVHGHPTSFGCLQISRKVLDDVQTITGRRLTVIDALRRDMAIWICQTYLDHWATKDLLGHEPTDEDRARIWVSGPNGWTKPESLPYWNKVSFYLHHEEFKRAVSVGEQFRQDTRRDRDEGTSFVEAHERTMLLSDRPEILFTWRSWNPGVPSVAEKLRDIFRRYGPVPSGDDAGSKEQSPGLLAFKLSVGHTTTAEQQHTSKSVAPFSWQTPDLRSMGSADKDLLRNDPQEGPRVELAGRPDSHDTVTAPTVHLRIAK